MTTRITEVEDGHEGRAVLRVEGSLGAAEVEVLERACAELREGTGREVLLDLTGLSFLDTESAAVLARLRREENVALEGLHFFIQQVIDLAERSEARGSNGDSERRGK